MFDILIQRALRRIHDALPGRTTASRLMRRQSSQWKNLPPHQRAAAYVQFMQTKQQLRQLHIDQKIAPKIINLLFKAACSELGITLAWIVGLCALFLLFAP
jgi:hypothetical protein